MKNYQKLAGLLGAIQECERRIEFCKVDSATCAACAKAQDWIDNRQDSINCIMQAAPRGSGFDAGTTLEQLERPVSTGERLVFKTSYHHMTNDMYDGWTEHTVTATPSLRYGYNLKVSGKDRNGIKEYIAECFSHFLDAEATI